MDTIRKPIQGDVILAMFPETGIVHPITEVYEALGFTNDQIGYRKVRVLFSHLRHRKIYSDDNRIDVRISSGNCIRVN